MSVITGADYNTLNISWLNSIRYWTNRTLAKNAEGYIFLFKKTAIQIVLDKTFEKSVY